MGSQDYNTKSKSAELAGGQDVQTEAISGLADMRVTDAVPQVCGVRDLQRKWSRVSVPTVLTKLQKWGDYPSHGSLLWPTKLLPMKTPLSQNIVENWTLPVPPKHIWTIDLLLKERADIGLIIDLSNHETLYAEDMPPGLQYKRVQLVAKVVPNLKAIKEFVGIATAFWAEQPDKCIAVHCAYGFNRTGFVVCSYLCDALGMSADAALDSFAVARPPGIRHESFITELYRRYPPAATPKHRPDMHNSSADPPSAVPPTPAAVQDSRAPPELQQAEGKAALASLTKEASTDFAIAAELLHDVNVVQTLNGRDAAANGKEEAKDVSATPVRRPSPLSLLQGALQEPQPQCCSSPQTSPEVSQDPLSARGSSPGRSPNSGRSSFGFDRYTLLRMLSKQRANPDAYLDGETIPEVPQSVMLQRHDEDQGSSSDDFDDEEATDDEHDAGKSP